MSTTEFIKESVHQVANVANRMTACGCQKFADELSNHHRTMQQNFTRMCVSWLEHLASQDSFDNRNEASVRIAKEFVDKVENRCLPYV